MAVAERPRSTRASGSGPSRRGGHGPWWWGEGAPPTDLWPGVSVDFAPTWSSKNSRWETHAGRYFFDAPAADRACDFFPDMLRHHMGEFAGQPFALMEYQKKLLTRPIFGWKRADDGMRRIRKLFGFIPKGGGKSPWASGTMIYMVRCDGEAAAEGYALANDRMQARTVHENCKIMVEESPLLHDGADILKDSIYWRATRSTLQVLSSEASSAHGKRPHVLSFDELHGFDGDRDRELFEALAKSLGKRRQPLLIIISHAGTDDEGLCFEEYEYAKAVLGGGHPDETHLPVVFEAKKGDDWTSETVLRRVHPGYGITVKTDALATDLIAAKSEPRKQNDYKRYYLNLWTNQASAWIPVEWWDACEEPLPSDEELRELPVALGIDMAQKIDLASIVAVFRLPLKASAPIDTIETSTETDEGEIVKTVRSLNYRIAIVPAFWLPAVTLEERVRQDGVRYDIYTQRDAPGGGKELKTTEGAIIDFDAMLRYIKHPDKRATPMDLATRFPLVNQAEIGYDPAFATELAVQLRDRCGFKDKTVEVLQNYKYLSEACQVFEALVKAGRVLHGGHRLLRWNLENVAIKTDDAGRIRPVKPRRATKRIDGIVATIIALSRLMHMPDVAARSVYATRGAMVMSGGTESTHA